MNQRTLHKPGKITVPADMSCSWWPFCATLFNIQRTTLIDHEVPCYTLCGGGASQGKTS